MLPATANSPPTPPSTSPPPMSPIPPSPPPPLPPLPTRSPPLPSPPPEVRELDMESSENRGSPLLQEDYEIHKSPSEYWSCSDCSSAGTYHTCLDCLDVQSLFTGDVQSLLEDDTLLLEDVFSTYSKERFRVRSRSLSPAKARDLSRSRCRSKSLTKEGERSRRESRSPCKRIRSISTSSGENLEASFVEGHEDIDLKRKAKKASPEIHPDGEARRQKSPSRSASLTREIVDSFLDFRDKILLRSRSRSRSKSGDRDTSELRVSENYDYESLRNLNDSRASSDISIDQEPETGMTGLDSETAEELDESFYNQDNLYHAETESVSDRNVDSSMKTEYQKYQFTELDKEKFSESDKDSGLSPNVSAASSRTLEECYQEEETDEPEALIKTSKVPSREVELPGASAQELPQNFEVSGISDNVNIPVTIATQDDIDNIQVIHTEDLPILRHDSKTDLENEAEHPSTTEVPTSPLDRDAVCLASDAKRLPSKSTSQESASEYGAIESRGPKADATNDLENTQESLADRELPPLLNLIKKSGEWLELRVVELSPGLVYLGSTLDEAVALQEAHHEVLTKLQSKQSPVEDLLNQADQLISTQRPRAEVYAAMAESLGLAWRDLNAHLETRKQLLDMSVAFHTRARQYSDSLDAAEKLYTDNVMPNDVEGTRKLLTMLHDHKRSILESSMFTLQEAHVLLARLRGLLQEGGTMDSRPQHIRINIEFACSQIEHHLESLHDRRRFLDGLFVTRKHHLEQCLALCLLYKDLTEAVLSLKQIRDEISEHQNLGGSQANAEILLHEHLRREAAVKTQQDQCIRNVRTAEQMVESGHYAGAEAKARAYSVLEAATALHETCDTRTGLLEQSALFFRLANTALTKLDQAEVQVVAMSEEKSATQRLSVVMGVVEEAIQPALAEGYALLEVTGGRGQSHNQGVTDTVEQLEGRRARLSSVCANSTEEALQRTELINSFLEMYNSIESWLVRIGDSFLQGHQDPGGSLSLAKDFLHLHLTLKSDLIDKNQDINSLDNFLEELSKDLSHEETASHREQVNDLREHWNSIKAILESRISLSDKYVKFHEDADLLQNEFELLELLLKNARTDSDRKSIEEKWKKIQKMFAELTEYGLDFIAGAKESEDPYLDLKRAVLCVEAILKNLGKRQLVIKDLHSHYQMKITINKELAALWTTYRENLKKMELEMQNLEDNMCPLLRGNSNDPEAMAVDLETRLNDYVISVKKIQEKIENMVTKAEGMTYTENAGTDRPEVVRSLLQLYQNLQNKTTDYQILGTMLAQWCRNIAEVHRSCDNLERHFGVISSVDIGGVEVQLREHEASKHAISELFKFAQHEADSIIQKIRVQCPREPGSKDIARMKEMLEVRRRVMEETWIKRQVVMEKQWKKTQYEVDLKAIKDQLQDLSDQLSRMQGNYGDSLASALNMNAAFKQFKITVELLGRRVNNFTSTAEKTMGGDEGAKEIRLELADLQKKWSTFQMQVGQSQKSIELSIEFFKLVQEAEVWFKEGSNLLVKVAGESSHIQTPDQAQKLRQRIDIFLTPGEVAQANRISKISSLAVELFGDVTPQQVDAVSQQNKYMLDSFNIINQNLSALVESLKAAEQQRHKHEKEQRTLVESLALAQAEAEAARLAAAAAEEARRAAEEAAKAIPVHTVEVRKSVEVVTQTDVIPPPVVELPPLKKVKVLEEARHSPPVFLTPLVGAAVTEGVKFSFECRVAGFPMPKVEWLKDGLSIMTNPDYGTSFQDGTCTLTIEETFTEDSALFTCRAVNDAGMAETSATLTVKEAAPTEIITPPKFTKRLLDSFAQEGSSFQFEATVEGHPLPNVTWMKDGRCIDDFPDFVITYNNGLCILRIDELGVNHHGDFECKAANDYGEDVTKAKLTVAAFEVNEKPSFPIPLSNLMARAGQKFKLECQVKGVPTPNLTWMHNNKPVKETSDIKITFDGTLASLVISEAFPKNAGYYTLVAQNVAGEAQTSSNVSVKGRIPTETSDSEITSDVDVEPIKPSIQQPLKDLTVGEGQFVRLDCIIVGQPEPEVIWYHDEKPVKESEDFRLLFHGDRCSLIIQEAYEEDAGFYKVVAMNSAGEASTACLLMVKAASEKPSSPLPPVEVKVMPPTAPPNVAPQFTVLLVDGHVPEGMEVSLKARVTGSPYPNIAWFRDGVPLMPDDQLNIEEDMEGEVKVHIPRATLDHTGQYEVVASNQAGIATSIGFLSIEPSMIPPRPREPQNPPVFTKLLKDTTVTTGDSATFEAAVIGKPNPSIYWSLNDCRLSEQDYSHGIRQYSMSENPEEGRLSLKILCASTVQNGRLCIVAENEVGKAISACHLNIVDPPKIPEEPISIPETVERRTIVSETHVTKFVSSSFSDVGPSHQSFTESSSSHITSATGQPTVEVHGSRIQQVSQEGSEPPQVSEKEKVIKIDGQNIVEQFITDTATAAPPALPKKTVVKRKSTPARFIVPLQGVIVQENNKVTFEASIDGYPEPTVEWSHNGGPLPPEATTSFELNKASLAIPKVQQNHSGRYTCSLDNEAGSAQCTCDLVVKKIQFPPVFSKRLQPVVIGVGERLHLEVDLSGTPTPDVQWTRNGQDLFSGDQLIIKGEGTRHWLVIPEAVESDSGRYGITGSNSAGRAECLADVLVTKLTISEPQQTFIFRDLSDDTRSQSKVIEAGHVKSLKEIVEARSFETHVPLPPVNLVKSVNDIPLQPKPTPSEVTAAPPPPSVEVSEEHFEKKERKLPGKLRFSWPPPPSDDESLEAVKVDPYLDIAQNKVSTIVSTFSSITEPELPPIGKPPKHITEFNYLVEEKSPELPIPEPVPEYGFIQVEDKVDIFTERVVELHKSLTPEVYDTDFSDNVAPTSVTSDYYPKTSPSFELDSIEKPQSSLLLSTKDDLAEYPEKELEAKESVEDMEVRTERHVRESSITEVTKSVSSSEKTIVETKIYRDYSDGLDVPIFQQATPSQVQEVVTENISEHVIPVSEQPVESTKEYEVEEYKYERPEQQSYVEKHEEDIPDTSSAAEGPFFSHSFSSKEKSYASTVKESHASYVSLTEIESKVYPYQQGESSRSSVFESTQSFLKPATVVVEEKKSADELTSGDEARTLEIKPRKKRESVRQIALRLEENIMPISPEEVPGGIRMFPPKPQTPSVDSPQPSFISKEKASIIPKEEIVEEKPIFSDFPKLEPFPFVVEEKPTVERPRGPPPAKPKKFVPGAFTDSEYDSDFDLPIGEKFIPKKIHFEGTAKSAPKANVPGPPPPSFFDSPPKIEAMRPEILTKDTIFEAKIEDKPKEVIPRKQPRVVQKFFDKAGQHAELEITSPKAPKGIVHSEVQSETFQQKKVAFIDESHIQMPAKPVSPAPSKIKKAWPPQQEEIVVPQVPVEEFTSPPETVVITRASEVSQQMHVKEFTEVERKGEKMEHPQEKLPIIEIDVVKKPAFTAETLPKPELPQVPHITPLASKFKSVQAPSFQAKKPQQASAAPAPPFDMPFPTIKKPVPTKMEASFSINKVFSTTSVETKQITQRESKTIQEQTQSKDFQLRKQRSSWQPKVDESPAPVATPPWMEVRSQSLERPHVTEATILPPKSYEAPPSIYWSSSISLKEKRASLPMQFVQDPLIITSSVDEKILTASSLKNIHASSSTTIEQLRQQKPYHKHVTIAEVPSVSRKLLVKSPVAHRRPTPAPDEMILGKKETKPLEKLPSKRMIDIADIGFKPIPKGEPFPFEVPRDQERRRDNVPPPSKPSKFIPGSFTESDYESDYEGKVPPVWRPYMSDTESTSFRPVKVKLKQGRHRQPKGPSPPPPSQFDSPSNVIIPLKQSLSLLDFASEVPLVTEPSLIKVTADLKKKQLPSTTFTPKLAALQPKIVAHQSKIVAPQPKIVAPQPKIVAPQPRIVMPQPKIAAPSQQMPLPVKSQVSAAPVRKEVKVAEPIPKKTTVGVRSVKEKFEMSQSSTDFHPMQFGSRVAPAATLKSSSLSPVRNGPVPLRPVPPIQTQQTSAFDQQFKSEQSKSSVMSSLPDLTFHPDTIPVKVTPLKGFQSVKPSSPKGKKKLEVVSTSKDMEESGYAADTEATLPRRFQKISTFQEGGGSTSSSYSKSETSFQSNVSKSFHSAQSSFTSGVPGFPSGFGDSGGFPPPSNGGPGLSFPSFPSHPLGQETRTSSSFTSSESKSSQVYSTTKSEEYYERRSDHVHKGSSGTTPKDMKDHRESKHEDKKQKDHKKPIFEEFHRETKGTPHSYGPFSEDSYYSMHDESEEIEDGRKKKSKVEMKTESHVQVMSDKKSEFYSYSSGDNLEKPQKESPKLKKKKISKPHSEIKIEIETQVPKKDISKMESYHKEELSKEQILKTTTSSDFEQKKESARSIHRKSPTPSSKYDRHIHQEYEQMTKPKIEFPESESDSKESLIKPKKIVRMKPEPPRIVPKEPLILKSEPPKKTEYKEAPSQLKREPPPEEGYIHHETYPQYPSAVGVESTRVTKIEDSSQFHKRFVTMQQTTRVVKFNGSAVTTTSKTQPDVQQRVQPMKLHVRELPSIEMKPMPNLEPFPFTPEPPTKPRHRGQPPSKPKKFVKGDMRESDYDSDIDIKVKPKWQPPDSDAEELSYGKVEAPKMTKHRVSSKERTPTPPSVFDTPPPTGEPMRPMIEPVDIIPYKEPSPEIIVPKEEVVPLKKKIQLTTAKVRPVKPEPVREPSPPLPPPEPEPEVGVVVEKTDYVVNGINLETKPAPLTMKAVPTIKKKPYREIIEKTEKKITSRHYKEEKKLTTQKLETVKITVTDIKPKLDEQRFIEEKKITGLEKFSKLEPFPFEPEEKHPKREKVPPPPQPNKFVKGEMSDREYDSDYDIKITPKWKPSESDVEEPHYNKLDISLPKGRRPEKGDRTPTPPSKFDTGPIETGPLRPSLDEVIRDIQPVIQAEPRLIVVKQALSEHIKREVPIIVPEPEPEIGFIEPETKSIVQRKPDIDIDIDIVDIYDYMSESDLERGTSEIGTSEIGSYKPVPELEPFPYSPEPPRPRRERGPPPPTPRKFLKGEFRGSDYESDRDIKIIPKWAPTDSDGEGLAYRKVQPPAADTKRTRTVSTERVPSPPSKFDHPPHFEGPPRPIVDLSDIPRRERRESLEEYSIPKFPKVEFKPFDLEDETKLRTQTSIDKRHVKTTQKYVGEQFEDMHKTFRHKAQKFAEQLVTEVFASKDDTGTIEPSPPIPKDQRVPSEAKIKPTDEGLDQPQTYRDESRLSEFDSSVLQHLSSPSLVSSVSSPIRSTAPKIITPLKDTLTSEGGKVNLECIVKTELRPRVTWFRNAIEIQEEPRFQTTFRNGVCRLIIDNPVEGDSGHYTCVIENASGQESTAASIMVVSPGEVS